MCHINLLYNSPRFSNYAYLYSNHQPLLEIADLRMYVPKPLAYPILSPSPNSPVIINQSFSYCQCMARMRVVPNTTIRRQQVEKAFLTRVHEALALIQNHPRVSYLSVPTRISQSLTLWFISAG